MKKKIFLCFVCLTLAQISYAKAGGELEKDIRYYERISLNKSLNTNDRLYIILKIRDKHKNTGEDLSWVDSEIDRLQRTKPVASKNVIPDVTPPQAAPQAEADTAQESGVSDIEVSEADGKIIVSVFVNNPGRIKHFPLTDSKLRYNPKIVVDIEKTTENVEFKKKDYNPGFEEIKRVRIGQFQEKPEPVSRIIIEMDKPRKYALSQSKSKVTVTIEKDKKDAPQVPVAAAPKTAAAPVEAKQPSVVDIDAAYKIGPGDIVRFDISPAKELSSEKEVDSNGFIRLELIDKVKLDGLTEKQSAELVKEKLSRFLKNPDVKAKITRYGAKKVFVLGQTNLPSESEYEQGYNIYDFIRQKGGFKPAADLSAVALNRGRPGKRTRIYINLSELLRTGQEAEIPLIEPGDIIEVAEAKTSVSIIGEVEKPGKYEIQGEGISIFKLLASADGHSKNAYLKRIVILKADKHNGYKKVFFNLEKALKNTSKGDIVLQPGDIVYVPSK